MCFHVNERTVGVCHKQFKQQAIHLIKRSLRLMITEIRVRESFLTHSNIYRLLCCTTVRSEAIHLNSKLLIFVIEINLISFSRETFFPSLVNFLYRLSQKRISSLRYFPSSQYFRENNRYFMVVNLSAFLIYERARLHSDSDSD